MVLLTRRKGNVFMFRRKMKLPLRETLTVGIEKAIWVQNEEQNLIQSEVAAKTHDMLESSIESSDSVENNTMMNLWLVQVLIHWLIWIRMRLQITLQLTQLY